VLQPILFSVRSVKTPPTAVVSPDDVRRRVLVPLILLVVAALPAFAYASPPDPSWIPGLYDDADYDDVVGLATSSTDDVALTSSADLQTILSVVDYALAFLPDRQPTRPASVVRLRAPPTS